MPGADSGGVGRAPPPPKIGKNLIFWRKIVIFHTKYPNNFRASLCIWKKSDFFGVKSWGARAPPPLNPPLAYFEVFFIYYAIFH
jgi:hypothetical protein